MLLIPMVAWRMGIYARESIFRLFWDLCIWISNPDYSLIILRYVWADESASCFFEIYAADKYLDHPRLLWESCAGIIPFYLSNRLVSLPPRCQWPTESTSSSMACLWRHHLWLWIPPQWSSVRASFNPFGCPNPFSPYQTAISRDRTIRNPDPPPSPPPCRPVASIAGIGISDKRMDFLLVRIQDFDYPPIYLSILGILFDTISLI